MRLLLHGKMLPMSIVCACLLAVPVATAQYQSNFEALNASAAGTLLTGQDGYYIPAATTSVDFMVYTYTGNVLGMPQNPTGQDQFVAAEGVVGVYGRAQRDIVWPTGTVTVGYDMAGHYTGTAPSSNNLGSFSTQLYPGEATYIHLMSWSDPQALTFQALYYAYDAAGVVMAQPGASPGPEWENLPLDHWYRFETMIDFAANQITGALITDLTTAVTTTAALTGVYLEGGAAGGSPHPSGFRFFAGGGTAGNVTAWDNISIVPEPSALVLLALGGLAIFRRR